MDEQEHVVADIVDQTVRLAHPVRVLIFGSRARGEDRVDSDIDVLVVVPEGAPCRRLAQELYAEINGHGIPSDLIVATPSVLRRQRRNRGLVYRRALQEGKEVYAA